MEFQKVGRGVHSGLHPPMLAQPGSLIYLLAARGDDVYFWGPDHGDARPTLRGGHLSRPEAAAVEVMGRERERIRTAETKV